MTATLERLQSISVWKRFCSWITLTENRLYMVWCVNDPSFIKYFNLSKKKENIYLNSLKQLS